MKVIFEQNYDLVDIYDIIEDEQLEEFCKYFYEMKIRSMEISTLHNLYNITYNPNYITGLGPSITWEYFLKIKPMEELNAYYKEVVANNPNVYKDTKQYFGFEYANFEGINNFKQIKNK